MDYLIPGADFLAAYPNFRLVGRDADLHRLLSVLMRQNANSVLLEGPGGVGCTSLCLGIQAAKSLPDAPLDVLKKRLFWLDVDALFALGENAEISVAFHKAINRLASVYDAILVIADTRDFIDACRNNGLTHFLNALLSQVHNKKFQVICESGDDDCEFILKSHTDFRELFTIVPVDEPVGSDLRTIIGTIAKGLAKHHGIGIADDAIDAAIEFTSRYHTRDSGLNRAQPERSSTLLDRALSSYRLDAHQNPPPGMSSEEWSILNEQLRTLNREEREGQAQITAKEEELDRLAQRETDLLQESPDNARMDVFQQANFHGPDYERIAKRLSDLKKAVEQTHNQILQMTQSIDAHLLLTRTQVLREFSRISGIAADKLDQDEVEKLKNVDKVLDHRIFGQAYAVSSVTNGVRVARVGHRHKNAPLPFLFLGPSGVGKTELSKALAEGLYDDEAALIRFDMSEYMEKHAVAKLIGAPPGYEGFEQGGILTNLMRKGSNRILLFDEIEKAHPDIFNIFLQILSDGRLTDNVGRTVSFDSTIILMTTNIGQSYFLDKSLSKSEAQAEALKELDKTYRSEFLNRFAGRQNIIYFQELPLDAIQRIVKREIDNLDAAYSPKGISVSMDDSYIVSFCQDQYDPRVGARGLPGYIAAHLEPDLVNAILADPTINTTARIGYDSITHNFETRFMK